MSNSDPHQRTHTSRRKLMRNVAIGAFGAAVVDAFAIEPRWLRFHRTEIPIEGLPVEFDGYRIGLMSDTHIPRSIDKPFLQRACRELMRFRPDVVALPGDFVEQPRGVRDVPRLSGFFDLLSAPDGVLGTLGNHDHWVDAHEVRSRIAEDTPITLIEGRSIAIRRGASKIFIGGVDDLWCGSTDIDHAFQGADERSPRILLSHNPDLAERSTSSCRVELMLSGHTHGGQIRIPFGPALHTPSRYGDRFARGLVQGKKYRVFVTQGVCSVRGVRFCCRPEVCGIVLRRA